MVLVVGVVWIWIMGDFDIMIRIVECVLFF